MMSMLPMTALSSSWGFCRFGSFNCSRTASRASAFGPFRIKWSKNLWHEHTQSQYNIIRHDFSTSLECVWPFSHLAAANVIATHISLFCVTRMTSSTLSSSSGQPAYMATTGASLVTPSIWQSTSQPQNHTPTHRHITTFEWHQL